MPSSPDVLPALRADIQLIPVQHQGRPVVFVKDALGVAAETSALDASIVPLLSLFDGVHTVRDLQLAMMRMSGNRLVLECEARRVIDELDRLFVLSTARYEARCAETKARYSALPQRPPSHAGTAYPADRGALCDMIDGILRDAPAPPPSEGSIRAVVAPHIDLSVGAPTYGRAYAALRGGAPRRVVVLGTGHAMGREVFALSSKQYVSPFGAFPIDSEAVGALQASGSPALASDDFAHRSEHSIEFQMLFLLRLLPADTPVVPLLCGSVSQWLPTVERFVDIPGVHPFLASLREVVDDQTLVVAGVDLSHVGPKFGHRSPASIKEGEFRRHDEALLAALCTGSPEGFWAEARRVQDGFNVCGLSALATLLEVLPGASGTLLDYRVWHEHATRSAVSFAAVVMGRGGPSRVCAHPHGFERRGDPEAGSPGVVAAG